MDAKVLTRRSQRQSGWAWNLDSNLTTPGSLKDYGFPQSLLPHIRSKPSSVYLERMSDHPCFGQFSFLTYDFKQSFEVLFIVIIVGHFDDPLHNALKWGALLFLR